MGLANLGTYSDLNYLMTQASWKPTAEAVSMVDETLLACNPDFLKY